MKILILALLFSQNIDSATLEKKSIEAREILKKENVSFRRAGKAKNSRIVSRDILLAVYSQKTEMIDIIRLEVSVPKSLRDSNFNFKVVGFTYGVQRIAGKGITRLEFDVFKNETLEDVIVLDSRHLHLEKNRSSPRDLFYFPYSDIFQNNYFTKNGKETYFDIISEAVEELCDTETKSLAFSDKLLCKTIPISFLTVLGAIEQTDDGEFFSNSAYALKKFSTHIARNNEKAFSYSVSVDGARGLMQFMNSSKIGTYNLVRKKYPKAKLIADFEKGTADMKNSIKAALCLADMNLAGMPDGFFWLMIKNPKIGGAILSSAHNGGLARARKLYSEHKKKKINWDKFSLSKNVLPKETENFVKKYLKTYEYFLQND